MSWEKSDYWLPHLGYRTQLFQSPHKKMTNSPTFHDEHFSCLSSFPIPHFLRNKCNPLLLCRGVLHPFLKPWTQSFAFHGPEALASPPSKLITTFLGTNTELCWRGMLANTASALSRYCFLYSTLFQMDSFVKGPPNV